MIFTSRENISKLQYNNLAFVRATGKGSLTEIAQCSPYYPPLNVFMASKGSTLYILFRLASGPKIFHEP